MSKNILVLTQPRTGSNLLCRLIGSQKNILNLGEYFGCSKFSVSLHTNILSQYINSNFLKGIDLYKPMLSKIVSSNSYHNSIMNYLNTNILKNYILFNNHCVCLKVFHNHFQEQNLNVKELFECFDVVFLLYRFNILDSFISFEKCMINDIWSSRHPKFNKKESPKIIWDLNKYKQFYETQVNAYKYYLELLRDIQKPKIVIEYENMSRQTNKYLYLQNIFKEHNLFYKIPPKMIRDPIEKQSPEIRIEENFINKQDFIQDYKSVKEIQYNPCFQKID